MKVLYIMSDYRQRLVYNLRDALVSDNVEMSFFLYSSRNVNNVPLLPEYAHMYNSACRLRTPLFYKKRIRNVLAAFDTWFRDTGSEYDVIHAHMFMSDGILAYETHKKYGTPYMVSVRNTDLHSWFLKVLPFARSYWDKVLLHAKKIVFPNPSYLEQLRKLTDDDTWKAIEGKCVLIPNGIDNFWLQNMHRERSKSVNCPVNVLTVGNIDKNKNQVLVASTIEQLNKQGLPVRYRVVGKVVDRRVAKKLDRYKNTKVIGAMPFQQLINEYRQADIYVLVSKKETFGLCYPEAMSQGLPIVYTKGEGFDGFFEEGIIGRSVCAKSKKELALSLKFIIDNYSAMVENSLTYAKEFDWNTIAKIWLGLFSDICKDAEHGNTGECE